MISANAGPAITSSQMDAGSVGNVANSVNLFRGTVTFPLTFLQLPGPNDLNVSVSATYDGNVASDVKTWNADAPTGLLGLGWDLPIDCITRVVDHGASTEPATYLLRSQGANSPLVPLHSGERDGMPYVAFGLAKYQPWRVLYFADCERWEITQESGVTYVYGDNASMRDTVQWGVRRGNWVDSSSLAAGEQFAVAWNLSEIRHYWGDTIVFAYDNDDIAIGGDDTLRYTRASRLSSVLDACGRSVEYRYLRKQPCEYAPPHGREDDPGQGAAYQDRYDDHYLASVSVYAVDGGPLWQLDFGYRLDSAVHGADSALYTKRYLTSVAQGAVGVASAPGIAFDYVGNHPGAGEVDGLGSLARISYPSGATARYVYGATDLPSRCQTVDAPSTGGVPRVWFGADYLVITWYDAAAGQLTVTAYAWSGQWVPWNSAETISVELADTGESLLVAATDGFFALSYLTSSLMPALRIFNKESERFGQWACTVPGETYAVAASSDDAPNQLQVGDDFIVFNPSGCTDLYRYTWDRASREWASERLTFDATSITLAARGNYVAVMAFDDGDATMTLHHHDAFSRWSTIEFPDIPAVATDRNGRALFEWSTGTTYAVASFVATGGLGTRQIDYDLRVYAWDPAFSSIDCQCSETLTTTTVLGLPPTLSRAAGSLVGNLANLLRYDGQQWQLQRLPCDDGVQYGSLFAYAQDVGLATNVGGAASGYAYDAQQRTFRSLPLREAEPNGNLPPRLTASEDWLTVGSDVYFRDPARGWGLLETGLPGNVNPDSIVNRAPSYIGYETGSGSQASAGVLLTGNGSLASPSDHTLLSGQRLFAGKQDAPGTTLCGENAFVTYSGDDLDQTRTLWLYHVANGDVGVQRHNPVVALNVDDGYQTTSTAYWYDAKVATFDGTSTVAQYARVRTFPGLTSAPADATGPAPLDCPNGFSETLTFNGMSPDLPGLFYPDDTHNYYSLLSGNALCQKQFDSRGRLVSCQLNRHRKLEPTSQRGASMLKPIFNLQASEIAFAFNVGKSTEIENYLDGVDAQMPDALVQGFAAAGYQLSGALVSEVERAHASWILVDEGGMALYFLRVVDDTIEIHAGFSRGEHLGYEPVYGLSASASMLNRNAQAKMERSTRSLAYAWQQRDGAGDPAYPRMRDLHILTAVALACEHVDDVLTAATLTLYDNDWGYVDTAWSTRSTYQAIDAAAAHVLDPDIVPDPNLWRRTSHVLTRNRRGTATETMDGGGVHASTIFDLSDMAPLVQVTNASVGNGDIAYYGAETYEKNPGWCLQPGAVAPVCTQGLAHTGTRSIRLAADPATRLCLRRPDLVPTDGGRYLFSCRYTTDDGFADECGDAQFQIDVTIDGVTRTLPPLVLDDTRGEWRFAMQTIDPVQLFSLDAPPASLSIDIAACNGKANAGLSLDELRFLPLLADFSGQVMDMTREVAIAQLTRSGQARRTVYDGNTPYACTSCDGDLVSITTGYQSRSGHGGVFDPASPSLHMSISPAGRGAYQDFRRSPDWTRHWQGDAAAWSIVDAALIHARSGDDTLSLIGSDMRTDFGMMLRMRPQAAVGSPLTLACGSAASVSWIPGNEATQAGAWRLNGDPTTDVVPDACGVLDVGWAGTLDACASVPPPLATQFASLGVRLQSAQVAIDVVRAGAQWLLHDDDAGQRYLVASQGAGLAVTCVTLPDAQWLLLVGPTALIFHVDGRPVFQAMLENAPTGPLTVTTGDAIGLQDILVFAQPRVTLAYQDACGRITQQQALECAPEDAGTPSSAPNCLVQGNRYDALGRLRLTTKPTRYPSALLGYRDALITGIDAATGAVQGDCNDYYSPDGDGGCDDGGYPYSSNRYGDWPGAGVIEQGQPGIALAITGTDASAHHTGRSWIGAHVGDDAFAALGLPAGDYRVATTLDADGNASTMLSDRRGRTLAGAGPGGGDGQIRTTYVYDAAGRKTTIAPPNAQADQVGATTVQTPLSVIYDFLGRTLQTSQPDATAPNRFAYDCRDRLRFMQDANGAGADIEYALYRKYDRLGRCVEIGRVDGDWKTIAAHADDPAWPPTAIVVPIGDASAIAHWCTRTTYDGDGISPFALGRTSSVQTCNGAQAQADVVETYAYDANGRVVAKTDCVADWSSEAFSTDYRYDAQGGITDIRYPDGAAHIAYRYDSLGRTADIRDAASGDAIARYRYTALGAIASEALIGAGDASITRDYAYTSPGWIAAITDPLLQQTVRYADADGQIYYNGRIAATSIRYAWPDAPQAYDCQFTFDSLGRLGVARNSVLADGNLGTVAPLTYDGNGNLLQISQDDASTSYVYESGSNRVADDGHGSDFGYDGNGNIRSATCAGFAGRQLDRIDYDPCSGLARTIAIGGETPGRVDYRYDSHQRRVLKCSEQDDGTIGTLLYQYGNGGRPLVEQSRNADGRATTRDVYVYGPRGLIRLQRGDDAYHVLDDYLGSTRALVDTGNGAVVAQFDYAPFGGVLRASGDTGMIRYLYTGQEYESDTGLYNYRARLYDSRLGRFYACDPLGEFASPYCYAGNDPIGFSDPSGMSSVGQGKAAQYYSDSQNSSGGIFMSWVELAVSGVEIVLGLGLSIFYPGPIGRFAGHVLLGAGAFGAMYDIGHWGEGMNKGGFLKAEGIGGALGAVSYAFRRFGRTVMKGAEEALGTAKALHDDVRSVLSPGVGERLTGTQEVMSTAIGNLGNDVTEAAGTLFPQGTARVKKFFAPGTIGALTTAAGAYLAPETMLNVAITYGVDAASKVISESEYVVKATDAVVSGTSSAIRSTKSWFGSVTSWFSIPDFDIEFKDGDF